MAGKSKAKKHKVRSMHIRKAHNGFIAKHEMPAGEDGMPQPDQEHVIAGDVDSLKNHVADHFAADDETTSQPS